MFHWFNGAVQAALWYIKVYISTQSNEDSRQIQAYFLTTFNEKTPNQKTTTNYSGILCFCYTALVELTHWSGTCCLLLLIRTAGGWYTPWTGNCCNRPQLSRAITHQIMALICY